MLGARRMVTVEKTAMGPCHGEWWEDAEAKMLTGLGSGDHLSRLLLSLQKLLDAGVRFLLNHDWHAGV